MKYNRHKIGLAGQPGAAALAVLILATGCSFGSGRLTFDGTSCTYEGPTTLTAGSAELTFDNQSGENAALALIELPTDEEQRAEELALVGRDLAIGASDDAVVAGVILAEPGEKVTEEAPIPAGSYVIDCATFTGDRPSHAWRAAAIEVE